MPSRGRSAPGSTPPSTHRPCAGNTGKRMGPLEGVKVVEFAGIGPAPMAAMLLADLGATVIRLDRPIPSDLGLKKPLKFNLLLRNRPSISVDLKDPAGLGFALELIE